MSLTVLLYEEIRWETLADFKGGMDTSHVLWYYSMTIVTISGWSNDKIMNTSIPWPASETAIFSPNGHQLRLLLRVYSAV